MFKHTTKIAEDYVAQIEYEKANPSKMIPFLHLGNTMVIGTNNVTAIHLCKTMPTMRSKLYQEELAARIDNLLEWFHENMEIPGKKIF